MLNTYTKTERNAYLMGMLGQNIIYCILSTGLNYYFQSIIFLPAAAISFIFTVSKVWDAMKDPVMGIVVDRTKSRWGKCRPYLIFSPIPIGILCILTFMNGIYSTTNTQSKNTGILLWAGIAYFLCSTAYTLGDIPLWGLASRMTQVDKDRSKLLTQSQLISCIAAGIASVTLLPVAQFAGRLFSEKSGDSNKGLQQGTVLVMCVLIIIATVFFQMTGLFTKERIPGNIAAEKQNILKQLSAVWTCKPFRLIMLGNILRSPTMLVNSVFTTLIIYYYGNNGQTSYLHYLIILGGASMLGQFLVLSAGAKIAERFEKIKVYNICLITNFIPLLVPFICYIALPEQQAKPVMVIIQAVCWVLIGCTSGLANLIQTIMITDTIDFAEYTTGHRPDGTFFSFRSLLVKISVGISSIIVGITYTLSGFSGDNVRIVNEALYNGVQFKNEMAFAPYRTAMFTLTFLIPAIATLISVIPTLKYGLTNLKHQKILEELNIARAKSSNTN